MEIDHNKLILKYNYQKGKSKETNKGTKTPIQQSSTNNTGGNIRKTNSNSTQYSFLYMVNGRSTETDKVRFIYKLEKQNGKRIR